MRTIPLIILAAALCAGEGEGPPVHAGGPGGPGEKRPPGPTPEELFQKADADQNGIVTLAELTAAVEARMRQEKEGVFARIDADGDGSISKAEFLAHEPEGRPGPDGKPAKRRGPDPAEMMKRLDRNGDGALTKDEMKRPSGREGRDGKEGGEGKGGREGGGPPHGDERP